MYMLFEPSIHKDFQGSPLRMEQSSWLMLNGLDTRPSTMPLQLVLTS